MSSVSATSVSCSLYCCCSGDMYANAHPVWGCVVSPPGASITPSRVTNSVAISCLLMWVTTPRWRWTHLGDADLRCPTPSSGWRGEPGEDLEVDVLERRDD